MQSGQGSSGLRLSVNNLACERGERRIFAGVSFTLRAGEALVITGRNGAGKSSLLQILAGRLRPAAGVILLEEAGERTLAECLHYVGHRDALKAALTAEENLAFARDFLGSPAMTPSEALEAVASPMRPACRWPISRPGSAAGWRLPASWWRTGLSGFSTSRPRPSTPPPRTFCASSSSSIGEAAA